MLKLFGYNVFEIVYRGRNSIVYRGIKLGDNQQPVIIKVPIIFKSTDRNKLQREWNMRQLVQSKHVVNYLELIQHPTYGYVLVEEDEQAGALSQYIPKNGFEVLDFLKIALQLAEGLRDIHQSNVIHNDIKPSNIVFKPDTGTIKYIDFGSASSLHQIKQAIINPDVSGGTLAYLSPEQTGRINRLLDYRTDFYALGTTFYQLLCGQLPFDVKNITQLVHCHIAKQPIAIHVIKSSIPVILSEIVMKLLKKDAEDRYQSASGLLKDLKQCYSDLKEKGEITPFILAQQDIPERLYIPQKLYGREFELSLLSQAFEQACQGKSEVVMLTGPAGTGKTVLVNEIQPTIVIKKGYFLTGKFDRANRNIAYSAITQVFQSWVRYLLITCSEDEILLWKKQLQNTLGNNSQLLIEVIPNLVLLIGQQPPVPLLDPEQTKNRFHLVFQNFITLLARPDHSLVLFLDDLQWADIASLKLLEAILTHSNTQNLLLIGAYRDNEVEATHPALITLDAIQKSGITIQTIPLSPLNISCVNQWVAEAVHCLSKNTLPLSTLIYQKTGGNPFFIRAFLQVLYEQELLKYTEEGWRWDLDKIRHLPATENIIEFMVHQIQQLPSNSQELLTFASYLGHRFTIATLQLVSQKGSEQISTELQALEDSGFLLQAGESYQFIHDRIQEAAYGLLPFEQQAQMHLTIGLILRANLPIQPTLEQEFEMIDHLNQGKLLITDLQERLSLTRLNIEIANKAKATAAYSAALNYLIAGEGYLAAIGNDRAWQDYYRLTYDLYRALAEVEYLNGHFDKSVGYINIILNHAQTVLEKVDIYSLLVIQKTVMAHYQEAIDIGFQALGLLGVDLKSQDLQQLFQRKINQVKDRLQNKTMADLLNAPLMTRPDIKATMKLLYNLAALGYIVNLPLYALSATIMVNLTLQYGNSEESTLGYAVYGMILNSKLNEIELSYQFGLLGIQLSEKFHHLTSQCRAYFLHSAMLHAWRKPLKEADNYFKITQQTGLEAGELQFLGYLHHIKAIYSFYRGTPLAIIESDLTQFLRIPYVCANQLTAGTLLALQLVVFNLSKQILGVTIFHNNVKSGEEYQTEWIQEKNYFALAHYLILKGQALYLHGQFTEALAVFLSAQNHLGYIACHFTVAAHNFYHSLVLTALYPTVDKDIQQRYWQQLETNQVQMKIWADNCAENFLHKYWLVAAEMASLTNKSDTEILYDRVIEMAQAQGFIQEHALACELAAKFWLSKQKTRFAQIYLYDAYNSYSRWGAKRKVTMIVRQYPELLKEIFTSHLSSFPISSEETIKSSSLALIDMTNVLKTSQTITKEISLPKLLLNVMQVMIENAGAQSGSFWLEEADALWLQADYSPEGRIQTLQRLPLSQWENGARSVIEYVKRTQQPVLVGDAYHDPQFSQDPFINAHHTKSVLCIPLIRQKQLKGVLYLENNLLHYAFIEQHQQILTMLASQMAISLENAILYESMRSVTERLNLALQSGNVGTWSWNIQNNKCIWDQYMCSLHGIKEKDFGQTFESAMALIHPEDIKQVRGAIKRTIEEDLLFDIEYRIIKPDKDIRVMISQGKIYRDDKGQVERLLGIVWDITQRKHLEQERLYALKQAEEKERRRAEEAEKYRKNLEEFINMVCHEIRNPMAGIYGNIDFLQQIAASLKSLIAKLPSETQSKLNETLLKLDDITQEIGQCVKHQKSIIDDVLDLSKVESGKMMLTAQPLRLKSIIEEAAKIFATPIALKNLQLILTLPESDPWVKGDANRLKIILINLMANALKFTEHGHITIILQLLNVTPTSTTFSLSVEDTGIGMTSDELSQLFRRFARVGSAEYEGSGLGLFISKRLIEYMGGQINVKSQKGQGSQFTIQLTSETVPVKENQPVQLNNQTKQVSTSSTLPAKHILVVEDNVVNQRILCRQLTQANHICEVANNGKEAIDKLTTAPFDLIFMDIEMPVMGGLEATKIIRQKEQQLNPPIRTPIIGLSAYSSSEFIKQAKEAGMDDYITKPYQKEKIYNTLKQWIITQQKPLLSQSLTSDAPLALKIDESFTTQSSSFSSQSESFIHEANPTYSTTPFWSGSQLTTSTPNRIWMPDSIRNLLYPILDTLSAELSLMGIHIVLPEVKYREKTSKTGWQLYSIKEKDECWAVLNLAQEKDVDKLVATINQSKTELSAKKMKSGTIYAVNIIFSSGIKLNTEIAKILPLIRELFRASATLGVVSLTC